METLLIILLLTELLACITGLVLLKKIKTSFLRYFSFYVVLIFLVECLGRFFKTNDLHYANKILYNYLVIPTEFIFFFWIFYRAQKGKKYKWLPTAFMGIYLTSWFIDKWFLSNKLFWFYSFSYTIGNLLLLILIFRFFIQLVTSDEILTFKSNILFWISSGLLVFYLGTFPYYGLLNTLNKQYTPLCISYGYVVVVLNCLMYLMFTLGFIWSNPSTKYSSS